MNLVQISSVKYVEKQSVDEGSVCSESANITSVCVIINRCFTFINATIPKLDEQELKDPTDARLSFCLSQ